MVDFILNADGNTPFLYYEGARDPGATEPDINQAIINANYWFLVRNTITGKVFGYVSGTSGSFVWKELGYTPEAGAHISDGAINAPTDAPEGLNVITTLLGALTGEVNAANTKQNVIATNLNALATKFNTLLDRLEAAGLLATS